MASSKAHPTNPAKKPPSSLPPPIPSRADLGEMPVEAVSSNKGLGKDDLATRESPKIKVKERPEITIVSARPLDSSGVIPPPSHPNQPTSATQMPTIVQKPSRKPKSREPPPRPKSRPVSEINLGPDEQDIGATSGEGGSVHKPSERSGERENSNGVEIPTKGFVARISAPVPPVQKKSKDKAEEGDIEGRKLNPFLDNNLESNGKVEPDAVKDIPATKKPIPKPTVIRPKPTEKEKNDSNPFVEEDSQNSVSSAISVHDRAAGKKSKPTVIVPAKPAKKTAVDTEGLKGKEEKKDECGEKPKPDNNNGGKPPPPAKKPKPSLKPKPYSSSETSSKPSTEEAQKEITTAPKPKSRPTVIVAARRPKKSEEVKPEEESSASKVQEDKPRRKSPSATESAESMREAKIEETAAALPAVKPRRVPTIIAPRPGSPSPDADRKPPKRPKRGPSIKAAPRRPISAPSKENQNVYAISTESQDKLNTRVSEQDAETVQQKSQKPRRPVSLPGVKGKEALTAADEVSDAASLPEESSNMTRKNSKKRLPPPRPPAVDHTSEAADATQKVCSESLDLKDRSKRSKPPPRPPAASHVIDRLASTPEEDKTVTQDFDTERSKKKNRPPRPSSKVIDTKHSHGSKEEDCVDEKPKPAKPAPVAPFGANLTKTNVTETRTVAESSADDHVQDMSQTRDSVRGRDKSATEAHEEEKNEKASSKAKPKPPRPPSSAVSSKSKPPRPSAPGEKEEDKEEHSTTQLSSVSKTYIEPSAIALYDYEPTAVDDLSFNAGDEIVLVGKMDDDWYIGRLGDQQGMFPVKFVEIIEDLPQEMEPETQPLATPGSSPFDVMSLYDFRGNLMDGELGFVAGEIIHVVAKINDDWLRGELREQTGAFPCNFVDISADVIKNLPQYEEKEGVSKGDEVEYSDPSVSSYCKALYDYQSDVLQDLSFNAGDVIRINKRVGEEWLEGKLHGKMGMFPAAYVEILLNAPEQKRQPEEKKHRNVEYGTALYDFTGTVADELTFDKGDKIEITERINDEWLRGKHKGQEGMFPRAFVQLSKEESETNFPPVRKEMKPMPKAKALFDFDGEFEDELCFRTGDIIVLLERVNDEWIQGELDARVGRFPVAFVEILTPLP